MLARNKKTQQGPIKVPQIRFIKEYEEKTKTTVFDQNVINFDAGNDPQDHILRTHIAPSKTYGSI